MRKGGHTPGAFGNNGKRRQAIREARFEKREVKFLWRRSPSQMRAKRDG